MNDRLLNNFDQRDHLKHIEGLTQHRELPWLFNIPNPRDAPRIIEQVLTICFQVGVEVGCGHEPTRTNLIRPGLWFAFDPSEYPQRYFNDAHSDWTQEEQLLVPPSYLLILVPVEFHQYLIPNKNIHTYLLRNPNYAMSGDLRAFDEVPKFDQLNPGQRVVIVRDSSINGPYERLLKAIGYPDPKFKDWSGSAHLTSDKPWNRQSQAEIFDFTKVEKVV